MSRPPARSPRLRVHASLPAPLVAGLAAAAALATGACAMPLSAPVSTSTAAAARASAGTAAAAARKLPGVACPQQARVVRPTHVPISCGDGSAYVIHVTWTSLTPTSGTAKGIVLINDCVPNCAAGHFQAYGSRLTFSHVHAGHGGPVFGRLAVRFTTRHPAGQRVMLARY